LNWRWLRTTVEKSQVRMISWPGTQVHREHLSKRSLPSGPRSGGQRTGRPGVHDVGVAREAVGLVALVLAESLGRRSRVNGQFVDEGHDRRVEVDLAVCVRRYQTGKGTPKNR